MGKTRILCYPGRRSYQRGSLLLPHNKGIDSEGAWREKQRFHANPTSPTLLYEVYIERLMCGYNELLISVKPNCGESCKQVAKP